MVASVASTLFTLDIGGLYDPDTVAAPGPWDLAAAAPAQAASTCLMDPARGGIKRLVYVQFDNTHFRRDDPNVPSDLEQMPTLLNFMKGKGTLLTNDHTVIISHTATGILSSLTGRYGDRTGVPVSNSFRYFNPNGTSNPGVSFAYWTDGVFDPNTSSPTDTTYNMLTEKGMNAPAPIQCALRFRPDVLHQRQSPSNGSGDAAVRAGRRQAHGREPDHLRHR
jgi:hypothetical protein